jgi:hypothetical protein
MNYKPGEQALATKLAPRSLRVVIQDRYFMDWTKQKVSSFQIEMSSYKAIK